MKRYLFMRYPRCSWRRCCKSLRESIFIYYQWFKWLSCRFCRHSPTQSYQTTLHLSSNQHHSNHSVVIVCYISHFSWFTLQMYTNIRHIRPHKVKNSALKLAYRIYSYIMAFNGSQYTKIFYTVQWLSLLKWPLNSTVWQANLLNWKSVQMCP